MPTIQQWNVSKPVHQIQIITHLTIQLWDRYVFCTALQLIIDTYPTVHVYKHVQHQITSVIQPRWDVLKFAQIITLLSLWDNYVLQTAQEPVSTGLTMFVGPDVLQNIALTQQHSYVWKNAPSLTFQSLTFALKTVQSVTLIQSLKFANQQFVH